MPTCFVEAYINGVSTKHDADRTPGEWVSKEAVKTVMADAGIALAPLGLDPEQQVRLVWHLSLIHI